MNALISNALDHHQWDLDQWTPTAKSLGSISAPTRFGLADRPSMFDWTTSAPNTSSIPQFQGHWWPLPYEQLSGECYNLFLLRAPSVFVILALFPGILNRRPSTLLVPDLWAHHSGCTQRFQTWERQIFHIFYFSKFSRLFKLFSSTVVSQHTKATQSVARFGRGRLPSFRQRLSDPNHRFNCVYRIEAGIGRLVQCIGFDDKTFLSFASKNEFLIQSYNHMRQKAKVSSNNFVHIFIVLFWQGDVWKSRWRPRCNDEPYDERELLTNRRACLPDSSQRFFVRRQ